MDVTITPFHSFPLFKMVTVIKPLEFGSYNYKLKKPQTCLFLNMHWKFIKSSDAFFMRWPEGCSKIPRVVHLKKKLIGNLQQLLQELLNLTHGNQMISVYVIYYFSQIN